ncbi:MAG: PilZ domain-containing protein [Bdellovibrionia bacterium]
MGKVLDLTSRLKSRSSSKLQESSYQGAQEPLNLTEARMAIMSKERRQVKRTILTEFVGAYAILPERGLMKVNLYDVSENGIAFDLDLTEGHFNEGDEVAMRVYLNHSTYFPFTVMVANARVIQEEGVIRHGTNFIKGSINDVALHHFIKFIENVSASLRKDEGDVLVSNIS